MQQQQELQRRILEERKKQLEEEEESRRRRGEAEARLEQFKQAQQHQQAPPVKAARPAPKQQSESSEEDDDDYDDDFEVSGCNNWTSWGSLDRQDTVSQDYDDDFEDEEAVVREPIKPRSPIKTRAPVDFTSEMFLALCIPRGVSVRVPCRSIHPLSAAPRGEGHHLHCHGIANAAKAPCTFREAHRQNRHPPPASQAR